ncbi:MAG TPA: hypothetical protein VK338_02100 [Candidatus Nitrosocosmicus sp.]|nr:hypothetical protein [Candidatus Nitrosocosmicus sp.]
MARTKKVTRSGMLPPELTTITPLSRLMALIAFLTIPIIAFFLGIRYQQMISPTVDTSADSYTAPLRISTPSVSPSDAMQR